MLNPNLKYIHIILCILSFYLSVARSKCRLCVLISPLNRYTHINIKRYTYLFNSSTAVWPIRVMSNPNFFIFWWIHHVRKYTYSLFVEISIQTEIFCPLAYSPEFLIGALSLSLSPRCLITFFVIFGFCSNIAFFVRWQAY